MNTNLVLPDLVDGELSDLRPAKGRPLFVGDYHRPLEMCVIAGIVHFESGDVLYYERDGYPGMYVVYAPLVWVEDGIARLEAHGLHQLPIAPDLVLPESAGA